MTKKYFNSIIEMATAIYEDRDVYTSLGIKLTYNPKMSNPWMYDGTDYMNSIWGDWGKCYEVVDWKESVSEESPKLCYVSNLSKKDAVENKIVGLITTYTYSQIGDFPFITAYAGWKYAIPVPKEAVLKWLVDNEE